MRNPMNLMNSDPPNPSGLIPIDRFREEYRFLSNFYPAPFVTEDGRKWPSSEHAFQAAKTTSLTDQETIRRLPKPGQAKRAGRRLTIRKDWERIKLQTMFYLLWRKFSQNPDLAEKLLATGERPLIEGNTWGDTYWGVCDGKGFNHLGQLLTLVRGHLRTMQDLRPTNP